MDDEGEDEYLDFAPAKHAVREAFAFCTVAGLVLGIIVYGLWTLAWNIIGAWG
jgi:hypothetical protein